MSTFTTSSLCTPSQLAWILCAAVSIASSRYILHDLGFHYPIHLLVLQLGATLLVNTLRLAIYSQFTRQSLFYGTTSRIFYNSLTRSCILSLSGILTLQAILHTTNISNIAIGSTTCYAVEEIITQYYKPYSLSTAKRNSYVVLLVIGVTMSLCGDYRLEPKGLLCTAIAGLLVGVAMILEPRAQALLVPLEGAQISICGLLLCYLLVLLQERVLITDIRSIDIGQLFCLLINLVSSAIALSFKGSILAIGGLSNSLQLALVPVGLLSLTGCLAGLFMQRSHTTVFQLCSFTAALLALFRLRNKQPTSIIEAAKSSKTHSIHIKEQTSCCSDSSIQPSPDTIMGRSTPPNDFRCTLYLLLAGFYIATIAAFLFFNFNPSTRHMLTTSLDSAFRPKALAEVVISMYREPTRSVASLISSLQDIPALSGATVHIYTKNEQVNLTEIRLLSGVHKVTRLPNIGRESGTYLYHILHDWDSLARHTLFMQAEAHNKAEFLWRLERYFDPKRTGMLDLGFRGYSYRCTGTDQWGWSDESGVVSRLYNEVYQTPCRPFVLSYKGQFLVSASRIRGIPRSVYEELFDALQEQDSWAHSEPYVRGRADTMSAPVFGYTIERLWGVIFQCSDITTTWQCPSFLGRLGAFGGKGECQCLDS